MMATQNLLVSKSGLKIKTEPSIQWTKEMLKSGQVLLEIDKCALTANVITYALNGVSMGYYDFFPVEDPENAAEYGRVPTWGTCTVVVSRCPFVQPGQRLYGMVPLSRFLVVTPRPGRDESSWIDAAPHRAKRDVVYNTYIDLKSGFYLGPAFEDATILVRPLFLTAWLLREAVTALPVQHLIITSASSKTGSALAGLVKMYRDRTGSSLRIIGATSTGNLAYCKSLGYFDELIPYTGKWPADMSNVVIVDMAGNHKFLIDLQLLLKSSLLKIIAVGMTTASEEDLGSIIGGQGFDPKYARPEFFFAPKYMPKGAGNSANMALNLQSDWTEFIKTYPLDVHTCRTMPEVESVLNDFVGGRVPGNISWVAMLGDQRAAL